MLRVSMLPLVFVCLWSTGYLGAKLGMPHADPMGFLAFRFGIVALVLAVWVMLTKGAWPVRGQLRMQVVIGLLVHFFYLGGVFVAVSWGLEAGVSAVIIGLQPILTALFAASMLDERLRALQWLGMALGLAGTVMVVARKLADGVGDPAGVAACTIGLVAFSVGAVLQKRHGDAPMLGGNAVQFAAAAVACAICALIWEDGRLDWHPEMIFALAWLVLVLSLGAVTLLYWLIRRGGAAEVASLFFLVPPCTAVFAWALFGEIMGPVEIAGLIIASLGVLLVNRSGKAA